jgi:hypothetical protein
MKKKELVIYLIDEKGEGRRVVEFKRIPLDEVEDFEIPIFIFKEDVVISLRIEEKT